MWVMTGVESSADHLLSLDYELSATGLQQRAIGEELLVTDSYMLVLNTFEGYVAHQLLNHNINNRPEVEGERLQHSGILN